MAPGGWSLVVEVEVARGALLEPEPVVVRRVLEEVRRLLEHVLAPSGLGQALARLGHVAFGARCGRGCYLRTRRGFGPLARRWGIDLRLGATVERSGLRWGIPAIRNRVQPVGHLLFRRIASGDGTFLVHQRAWRIVRCPSNRTQRLTLQTVDVRGVGAPAALQLEVLAGGLVESTPVA